MRLRPSKYAVALWVTALFICLLAATRAHSQGYLTRHDLAIIKSNWPDYQYAAKLTGVPVDALPAIHYRESNLKRERCLGGSFKLDLGPLDNPVEFKRRIREHEQKIWKLYHYPSKRPPKVSQDFRFACLVAAHELKSKGRYGLQGEALADAFWGYNGRASWHIGPHGEHSHLGSSYVWSDPKRGRRIVNKVKRPKGQWLEYTDSRPGAMVIYMEISRFRGGKS